MRAETAEDERGTTGRTKAAQEMNSAETKGGHGGKEQKELGEKRNNQWFY